MLANKAATIQNLLFILHQYRDQEKFFAQQSDWKQIDKPSIFIPKEGNGMNFQDFTLDKTKLDISILWSSPTLIKDMIVYIHPTGNERADWALVGAIASYDYKLTDLGSCLGLFFTDYTNFDNPNMLLIEGTSPTAIMTHHILQIGDTETKVTKFLDVPNFTTPIYRIFEEGGPNHFNYLTEPQILDKWPYLRELFNELMSREDELDITFSVGPPDSKYVHIVRAKDEEWTNANN